MDSIIRIRKIRGVKHINGRRSRRIPVARHYGFSARTNSAVAFLALVAFVSTYTFSSYAFFSQTVTANDNTITAGTLDFSLVQTGFGDGYDGITPPFEAFNSVKIINQGTSAFQYSVHAEQASGDNALCQALQTTARADGFAGDVVNVTTPVLSFAAGPFEYSEAVDEWRFEIFLTDFEASEITSQTCEIKIIFEGWQLNLLAGQGFSDQEEVTFLVSTADLVGGEETEESPEEPEEVREIEEEQVTEETEETAAEEDKEEIVVLVELLSEEIGDTEENLGQEISVDPVYDQIVQPVELENTLATEEAAGEEETEETELPETETEEVDPLEPVISEQEINNNQPEEDGEPELEEAKEEQVAEGLGGLTEEQPAEGNDGGGTDAPAEELGRPEDVPEEAAVVESESATETE